MFLETISNTKEETFKQCKLKYYFYYVKKLLGIPKNEASLNFGSYIHKIFEDGYQAQHISELEKLAESHKKTYKISSQYKAKTKACLENFLRFNAKLGETLANEYHFKIDLGNDISFEGYIDRIIKGKDGKYLIIDYKTSKREKTKADLFFDNQMLRYVYAIHKELDVPVENIMAAHYYPVTNNFVNIKFSRNQVYKSIKNLVNSAWEIRKAKKEVMKPRLNTYCDWCNYKELCPLYEPNEGKRQLLLENAPTGKRS